jgi:hypothetical protein
VFETVEGRHLVACKLCGIACLFRKLATSQSSNVRRRVPVKDICSLGRVHKPIHYSCCILRNYGLVRSGVGS